ncbi:hypothetical protein AMATHDRAFT_70897 [Amanita thiersii Skay4041]|uniref:Uncharacterized protein n=1 Tax=Amanita thiersii Skay4041 TaxID=703135 RepID=A0A2A9N6V3_9AGAR|nr:hypothetical protein AMATHDRAFT_70897 [Amanita thiersii Skay4041]
MSTACTHIQADPDISGIGIRINIYVTTLLLALVPNIPPMAPLINALTANAGISGAALLITALIEAGKHQLPLYHAIFIIHSLLFFFGTEHITFCMVFSYDLVLLFDGFAMYVWATAPKFGPSSECNDQIKYIILFAIQSACNGWVA